MTLVYSILLGLLATLVYELHKWWKEPSVDIFSRCREGVIPFFICTGLFQVFAMSNNLDYIKLRVTEKQNELTAAEDSVGSLSTRSLYVSQASKKLESLKSDLDLVTQGQIPLSSAEEVTNAWLNLIRSSSNEIRATNVVSPDFWSTHANMGEKARDAHEYAIKNGVRIRRLWIIDTSSGQLINPIKSLATQYSELGVENRFVNVKEIETLDGFSRVQTSLATIDFVIFDESTALLVTPTSDNSVLDGRLSRMRDSHVNVAVKAYEIWWKNASKNLDEIAVTTAP